MAVQTVAGRARAGRCLDLLRPYQWHKNLIAVGPALVSQGTMSLAGWARVAAAVLALIVMSCLVYLLNDVADRHRDRLHPQKCHRPIACGDVPVPTAGWLAAALLAVLVAVLVELPQIVVPVLGFLGINLLYSLGLKRVALLDLSLVAAGFVLRAWAGALAAGVSPSPWVYCSAFALCLMLVLGKRRHERTVAGDRLDHRPVLTGYPVTFLDQAAVLAAALAVMAYAQSFPRDFGPAGPVLVVIASIGVLRCLQLAAVHGGIADPSRFLIRNRGLQAITVLWCLALFAN